jgi:Ca2+-binding RTX toxin-like protein
VALLSAAIVLVLPAAALAGTVSADAGTVRFVDDAGAKDDLNSTLRLDPDGGIDPLGWSVSFLAYDPPLTTGPGCAEGFVSASRYCSTGDAPPAALQIDLGAGDDSVALINEQPAAPTAVTVAGGAGNDLLATYQTRAALDGGAGDDVLRPDGRPTALSVPPEPTHGGAIRGGAGTDLVAYDGAFSRIDVSLDGVANDGRPGEKDDVETDVENIEGADFGGTLIGSDTANRLTGGGSGDRIVGRGGRDELRGVGGDDTIDALDGSGGDRVDCGDGADNALLDAGDVAAGGGASCERTIWAPRVSSPRLRYRGARIAVALACTGTSTCRGTLRLTVTRAGKALTLAKAGYRARRGKRVTVRLKPGAAGRSALSRTRKLAARLIVAPAGTRPSAGRAVTVRR